VCIPRSKSKRALICRYEAKAIGAGSEGAQTNLQESYSKSMTLAEAETLALSTLKQVMEEKLDNKNVELAASSVSSGKFRIYSTEDLEAVIQRL
jgi:20S proteasome subunit alpha 5